MARKLIFDRHQMFEQTECGLQSFYYLFTVQKIPNCVSPSYDLLGLITKYYCVLVQWQPPPPQKILIMLLQRPSPCAQLSANLLQKNFQAGSMLAEAESIRLPQGFHQGFCIDYEASWHEIGKRTIPFSGTDFHRKCSWPELVAHNSRKQNLLLCGLLQIVSL